MPDPTAAAQAAPVPDPTAAAQAAPEPDPTAAAQAGRVPDPTAAALAGRELDPMAARAPSLTPLRLLRLGGSLAPWLLGSLTPLRLLGLCRVPDPTAAQAAPDPDPRGASGLPGA